MIRIIAVGKCKEKNLIGCMQEYIKRLQSYCRLEIVEVEELMAPQSNSAAQNEEVMLKEGRNLLAKIKPDDYVIVLDLHGKMLSSEQFSAKMEEIATYRSSNITFVIGGSLGLSKEITDRADFRWKFSDLTFTHQMIRLLLLEQIYRAFKIQRNEPYYK